ncbi:MAG: sulfatase-like hydrolase/transferase [Clostridiales bacterium]|nr:sulfatase-like hydrolase/transferase [Clostridiales bacterium]
MSKKPNIVFILSDDQGAWAMHCAGTPELITPNLDRLAREGMRFDDFFCASPVCSPARASLLTGRMPSAHGILDWLRSGNVDAKEFAEQGKENPYGGYADETEPIAYLDGMDAYTDELTKIGYTCALSGKWHMGDSVHPQHSFKRWFTIGKGGCYYYHPDIVEDGKITVRHGEYVTDIITDRALDFIDELSGKDDPFYLSIHYTAPHSPWEADQHPKRWIDEYDKSDFASIPDVPDAPGMTTGPVYGTPNRHINLRGYFAAISAMDENIGRVLDRLEARGILDDTLVIFTADNGMSMGHHGIWGKGNGTWPMNMYDTAVKVPFIARMKGIAPGTRRDEPVSACDLFPTLCELAGVTPAPDPMRPGVSFLPLLRGEPGGDRCAIVYDEYGPTRMIRTQRFKYVHRFCYGPNELYDMQADPGEEHNLYGQPEYDDTVLELRTRMLRWFDEHTVPELNGAREPVTGSGQFGRAGSTAGRMDNYAPAPRVTTPPRK